MPDGGVQPKHACDTLRRVRTPGNILWLVFGGPFMALGYAIAGIAMFVFIITIPFRVQSFKLAGYSLWPFGLVVVEMPGKGGFLNTVGNVICVIFSGIWLAPPPQPGRSRTRADVGSGGTDRP